MLCCAMGAGGEQKEWLATMAPLKNTIKAYSKDNQSVLLRDFHMIGSGYNEANPFEALMTARKSDGTKPVGSGSKITYRYYLQNAFFSAIMEIPEEQSELISQALINPTWDLFLGRKNCPPSDFIFRGVFDTEEEALTKASEIRDEKGLKELFQVLDGQHEGEVLTLNDVPITFGQNKTYKQRYVTVVHHDR